MSSKIAAFLDHVRSTPALQEKLTHLSHTAGAQVVQQLAALSAEAGHPISEEEWLAANREAQNPLSDSTLEALSGGGFFPKFEIQAFHSFELQEIDPSKKS